MCDERERLIGYVYDECDSLERQTIQAHLDTCPTCRREIGGLRKVRQDLLAWDVPEPPPIWRPVAVPAAVSPWSMIPAWAMTLAAGLLLMMGAAGGAVTYALLPHSALPVQAAAPAPAPVVSASRAADVAALEQRIADLEKTQAETAAARAGGFAPQMSTTVNGLVRDVRAIRQRQDEFAAAMMETTFETARLNRKQAGLEQRIYVTSLGVQGQIPGPQVESSR
jgi:hypothetical protein